MTLQATIKRNPGDGHKWWARDDDDVFIDKDKYQNDLTRRLELKGYDVKKVGE